MLSFAAQESIPHRDDSGHLQHDSVISIPGIKYLAFSFYLVAFRYHPSPTGFIHSLYLGYISLDNKGR